MVWWNPWGCKESDIDTTEHLNNNNKRQQKNHLNANLITSFQELLNIPASFSRFIISHPSLPVVWWPKWPFSSWNASSFILTKVLFWLIFSLPETLPPFVTWQTLTLQLKTHLQRWLLWTLKTNFCSLIISFLDLFLFKIYWCIDDLQWCIDF